MQGDLVVYSGGLDSTVLLTKVLASRVEGSMRSENPLQAIHFRYGQKHGEQECAAARRVCELLMVPIQFITLPFKEWGFKSALLLGGEDVPEGEYTEESLKTTVVPFRNGIMLSIAAGIAASQRLTLIHIAAHAGDRAVYPDCRAEFMTAFSQAVAEGVSGAVRLVSPFIEMSKADIVKLGAEIEAPIELSYSCYNGRELHCGTCSTCHARKEAFKLAGVQDPTEYEK